MRGLLPFANGRSREPSPSEQEIAREVALRHDGPADPARIDRAVCRRSVMPGANPLTFLLDFAALAVNLAYHFTLSPTVPAEPPLRSYVAGDAMVGG